MTAGRLRAIFTLRAFQILAERIISLRARGIEVFPRRNKVINAARYCRSENFTGIFLPPSPSPLTSARHIVVKVQFLKDGLALSRFLAILITSRRHEILAHG